MGIILSNKHKIDHKLINANKFIISGKFLHAIQLYKKLIDEFPDELEPYVQLANLYQNQNMKKEAEDLLLGYINKNDNNIDANIILAQIYLKNSNWEKVIEILQPIAPEDESISLFYLGYAYFMLEDNDFAKRYFENFLKYNHEPELFYEAQLFLAKIYLNIGEFNTALTYADKSEKFNSNFWELKYIYAAIYLKLKMLNFAVDNIEACLKLTKPRYNVYKLAGDIYLKADNFKKSEEYYLKCLDVEEKNDIDLFLNLADVSLKNKKFDQSVNYYNLALKLDSKHNIALKGKKNALSLLNKVKN
ncbi:MAG: hypothetical protein COW08_09105 [Ignavibacteriales bacterium CG12_big_fil_rev_8_21_14_0_65_30_8]|nr:MAG: hypothetical protein COW08_09105 [Ignavibacteriales bacterium CG12_big_fil_rev_8_21_14_0_65_30_8]